MKKTLFDKEMEDPKFKALFDEKSISMNIGEEIAKLRKRAHISQLELAKKTKSSRSAIAKYESGKYNNYNIRTLMKIAKAFRKKLTICFT